MNREESLRVINGFIKELDNPGGLTAPAAPIAAPKQETRPSPIQTSIPKPTTPRAALPIVTAPAAPNRVEGGLDSLIKGCAGFEIGSPAPEPAAPPAAGSTGLRALIQGCTGFEISPAPLNREVEAKHPVNIAAAAPAREEPGLNAIIKGCAGFEIGSSAGFPAQAQAPAAAPTDVPAPAPPPPVQPPDPETLAIRKAIERLNNKPLLASLLKYYASEAQKGCPSLMMLKSTRDNIMKSWPQLVFSPLISALEGAIS